MTIQTLPVLPLRDIVVFPQMIVPLFVGRDKSVAALEAVMEGGKDVLLVSQKDATVEDPERGDLFEIGCIATVLQLLKLPDGTVKVLVEGQQRARVDALRTEGDFFEADYEVADDKSTDEGELAAMQRSASEQFENYVRLNKKIAPEVVVQIQQMDDGARVADAIASNLAVKISDRQALLAEADPLKRLEMVLGLMEGEMGVLQVEKKIKGRVKRQMEKSQREYYLNEQMKAIQRELGDGGEDGDELSELEEKIEKTKLSKEAREKATGEVKKLKAMAPQSAEATVVRN